MKLTFTIKRVTLLTLAVTIQYFSNSVANSAPLLGSDLSTFTVIGSSTVTNIPTSTIIGNVGVWSSGGANAITGFNSSPGVAVSDPQVTSGLVHAGTVTGMPNAKSAQDQLTFARDNLTSLGSGTILAADLVGLTLAPGIYTVLAGTTNLSGTLILDGQSNANAAWVFQFPSTFITSANSVIDVINTSANAGLFWNVNSSATLGTNSIFMGNILALTSITLENDASSPCGRTLADNGAVTLSSNSLSNGCGGFLTDSKGLSGGLDVLTTSDGKSVTSFISASPIPEPSSMVMMVIGLLMLITSVQHFGKPRAISNMAVD